MGSISMANNGYGQYSVHPRNTKFLSEDNQPAEPVPSSSYGVQGGKVALQAGGTLLGAGGLGATAGWLTHQQELEASKKNPPATQPELPEILGLKGVPLTPAEIDVEWTNQKATALQTIRERVLQSGNVLAQESLFQDLDQVRLNNLEDVKLSLMKDLQQKALSEMNQQTLYTIYGVNSDAELKEKMKTIEPKAKQMRNFQEFSNLLNDMENANFGSDATALLNHSNNKKLLLDALQSGDYDTVMDTLKSLDQSIFTKGLGLAYAKEEINETLFNPSHISAEDLLAYQYKQADTNLTWEQAKITAQDEFNNNRMTVEKQFKSPAKVAEVEVKAQQVWEDAEAKIAKEIAEAEADFRAKRMPKVKPPTPKVNASMVEDSFLKELTKGGKTTKIAGGVGLGVLLLGAGLTAYSTYQDGQRKPPSKHPNFSMDS